MLVCVKVTCTSDTVKSRQYKPTLPYCLRVSVGTEYRDVTSHTSSSDTDEPGVTSSVVAFLGNIENDPVVQE